MEASLVTNMNGNEEYESELAKKKASAKGGKQIGEDEVNNQALLVGRRLSKQYGNSFYVGTDNLSPPPSCASSTSSLSSATTSSNSNNNQPPNNNNNSTNFLFAPNEAYTNATIASQFKSYSARMINLSTLSSINNQSDSKSWHRHTEHGSDSDLGDEFAEDDDEDGIETGNNSSDEDDDDDEDGDDDEDDETTNDFDDSSSGLMNSSQSSQMARLKKLARKKSKRTNSSRRRSSMSEQRRAANMRERKRMQSINEAFESLRTQLPTLPYEKKISKVDTLKMAIAYILFLTELLNDDNKSSTNSAAAKEIKKFIHKFKDFRKQTKFFWVSVVFV